MKAGETERHDCGGCGTEFAVTYEPKIAEMRAQSAAKSKEADKQAKGMRPVVVSNCPFCGQEVEVDDDDGDDDEE